MKGYLLRISIMSFNPTCQLNVKKQPYITLTLINIYDVEINKLLIIIISFITK